MPLIETAILPAWQCKCQVHCVSLSLGLVLFFVGCAITPEEEAQQREQYAESKMIEQHFAREIAIAEIVPPSAFEELWFDDALRLRAQVGMSKLLQDGAGLGLFLVREREDDCGTSYSVKSLYERDLANRLTLETSQRGSRIKSDTFVKPGKYYNRSKQRLSYIAIRRFNKRYALHLCLDPQLLPESSWVDSWRQPPAAVGLERLFQ